MKEEEERREVEDKKDIREKEREEEQEEKEEETGEGESWLELSMAEMELLQRMEEANRSNSILMLATFITYMLFTTRLIECDSKSLASLPSTNCNSTNSTGSSVHSRSSSECRSEVG